VPQPGPAVSAARSRGVMLTSCGGHRGPVAVVLTDARRRALAQAVTVAVRATATFTPIAAPAVTASRSFTLTR